MDASDEEILTRLRRMELMLIPSMLESRAAAVTKSDLWRDVDEPSRTAPDTASRTGLRTAMPQPPLPDLPTLRQYIIALAAVNAVTVVVAVGLAFLLL